MNIQEVPPSRGWNVHSVFENPNYGTEFLDTLRAIECDPDNPGSSDMGLKNLLFTHILGLRPRAVLELGTLIGSATLVVAQALNLNDFGKLYSVEPEQKHRDKAAAYLERAGLSNRVQLIDGFSFDRHVRNLLERAAPFDLMFIDANHNYASVKEEIHQYWNLLADDGLMFFHDTGIEASSFDTSGSGGVRRAVSEAARDINNFKVVSYEWPLWLNPCGATIAWKRGPTGI